MCVLCVDLLTISVFFIFYDNFVYALAIFSFVLIHQHLNVF